MYISFKITRGCCASICKVLQRNINMFIMFSMKQFSIKKRMCPCMSRLTYECKLGDSYYCTTNQENCERFIQKFDVLKKYVKNECDNHVNIMMK